MIYGIKLKTTDKNTSKKVDFDFNFAPADNVSGHESGHIFNKNDCSILRNIGFWGGIAKEHDVVFYVLNTICLRARNYGGHTRALSPIELDLYFTTNDNEYHYHLSGFDVNDREMEEELYLLGVYEDEKLIIGGEPIVFSDKKIDEYPSDISAHVENVIRYFSNIIFLGNNAVNSFTIGKEFTEEEYFAILNRLEVNDIPVLDDRTNNISFDSNGYIVKESSKLTKYRYSGNRLDPFYYRDNAFYSHCTKDYVNRVFNVLLAVSKLDRDEERVILLPDFGLDMPQSYVNELMKCISECLNRTTKTQFILFTHNTEIMNEKYFRDDELFVIEAGRTSMKSYAYSMFDYEDFSLKSDGKESYIEGRMGETTGLTLSWI